MTNQQVKALCEAKRLRVEKAIHLGALAGTADGAIQQADEALEGLLGALEGKSAAHVVESIPGVKDVYDEGTEDECAEYADDAWGFLDAAIEADKLGFVIEVQSPVLDDRDDEGSWGYCMIGYFYGETFEAAVVAAAERMPAMADRRKAAA